MLVLSQPAFSSIGFYSTTPTCRGGGVVKDRPLAWTLAAAGHRHGLLLQKFASQIVANGWLDDCDDAEIATVAGSVGFDCQGCLSVPRTRKV